VGPTWHPLPSLVIAIEKFVYLERSQERAAVGASITGEGPRGEREEASRVLPVGSPQPQAGAGRSRVQMEVAATGRRRR